MCDCKHTVFKALDEFYKVCCLCGRHVELQIVSPVQVSKAAFRPMNMTRTLPGAMVEVNSTIESNRPKIAAMVKQGLAWAEIRKALNLVCHWKTLRKIYLKDAPKGSDDCGKSARAKAITSEIVQHYHGIKLVVDDMTHDDIIATFGLTCSRSTFSRRWAVISQQMGVSA